MTISRISRVTIIVQDLNEALRWYTKTLGLEKRVDDDKTIPGFRWLTGSPKDQSDLEIVLLQARGKDELARVGHNAVWVLQTGDCRKTYEELTKRGVKFTSPPEEALGASPRFLNTCTATHLTWSSGNDLGSDLNRLPKVISDAQNDLVGQASCLFFSDRQDACPTKSGLGPLLTNR
jgi:catechol 2,3-dioxygenase-like lactoylglutathione lyase family enzyme